MMNTAKKYTTMQKTNYKLSFDEMRSLMLFLRDYDWSKSLHENPVLTKYIYDTCRLMYANLEKRGLRIIANKRMEKSIVLSFSDLELLSISIMAKFPHENPHISMVINKLMLDLPIDIINLLSKQNHEKSIN